MSALFLACLASCGVDLDPDPTVCPSTLDLDRASLVIPLGHQGAIGVDGGRSDCEVIWSAWPDSLVDLSDAAVSTVVTARRVGQATVTGARPNRAEATCVVTVLPNEFVALGTLPDTLVVVGLGIAGNASLAATLTDSSGAEVLFPVDPTWAVSNQTIATLTSVHGSAVVQAWNYGEAVITVTYRGPGAVGTLTDRTILQVVPAAGR